MLEWVLPAPTSSFPSSDRADDSTSTENKIRLELCDSDFETAQTSRGFLHLFSGTWLPTGEDITADLLVRLKCFCKKWDCALGIRILDDLTSRFWTKTRGDTGRLLSAFTLAAKYDVPEICVKSFEEAHRSVAPYGEAGYSWLDPKGMSKENLEKIPTTYRTALFKTMEPYGARARPGYHDGDLLTRDFLDALAKAKKEEPKRGIADGPNKRARLE
ncbi:hypothetical protein CI109_101309 [Kwoniella shandongensis]|uniref:Uncharacterized protein n=1 Tax=Kwoniella shandongensis TaxID=1734106 RepID=A0A5M6BU20_9TREE|nr:uncharacterized protein CI109_005313 [Kwoniella shandongensis]KAA5526356.1 hypothetical protein CI109_005313 [Kwoniella shandongensis]